MLRIGSKFSNYRKIRTKLLSSVLGFSTSTVLIAVSMGSALPMMLTSVVQADAPIDISSVSDLRNAIEHQADGQTWKIEKGSYGLAPFTDITAGCPSSCQTGWYFPITVNNITIEGVGNPTVYGTGYTANGDWSTQDLMAIFGNNVTIKGLTLMPKIEPNKTIEVIGNNTTIENTTIEPNTLVDPSEFSSLSDPTEAQWGGSIYYNTAGGSQTLKNVTVNNGGVSYHAAAAGVHLSFSKVTLNYATNVDWINGYRYSNHFDNPAGSTLTGTPQVYYHVKSTLGNLNDVLANLHDNDIVSLDSSLTTTQQITLTKSVTLDGNGNTLSPAFTKTDNSNDSALSIQANGVTVNNLIENGVNGTNLHGINVFSAKDVTINNTTVKNNNRTGLNVNSSTVTVKNLTTAHNGWDGVDVDKAGAVLTVNGTSHHTESTPDIYVDNTSVGKVVDTNHQYSFANNVLQAGDRVYSLKPSIPTNGTPNGGFEKTNNFYFKWDASTGSGPLTYEFQTSMNPASSNGVLTTGVWDNIKNGNSEQKNLSSPEIHSVGAPDGTWYWQVRAIDTHRGLSAWSPIWSVTIDTDAPKGLANQSPANGTSTTTAGLDKITWQAATDTTPVTYFYESSQSPATKSDGSFASPVYQSGPLATNYISTAGTPAGTYYWHVRAVDAAGNGTPWTGAWKVTVDNTPPEVPSASLKDSNNKIITNGFISTQHFTFNLSDASNDVSRYQLKYWNSIPGSHFNGENNAWSPTDLSTYSSGLGIYNDQFTQGEGTHYFSFSACDAAGNCSAYSTPFVVTFDETKPAVNIVSPTDFSKPFTVGPSVVVSASDTGSGLESLVTHVYDSTNKLLPICGSATAAELSAGKMSCDLSSLPNGTYYVKAGAFDNAGNNMTVTSDSFKISSPPLVVHSAFTSLHASNIGGNTPSQGQPAGPSQPQGTATNTSGSNNSNNNSNGGEHVLGVHTTTPNVVASSTNKAVDTKNVASKFFGVAWYWWALTVLAILALVYAIYRRANVDSTK